MIKKIFFSVLVIFSIFVFSTPNTVHASWAKAFGLTDSTGGLVWPGADCNYYLWLTAGESTSKKLYFSELDSLGVPQWTKTISGTGENNLLIIQLTDGGYFVYGTKTSTATGDDILWEKFDSSWNKVYGNTFGGANDESGGPNFTDDDGFLISGTTESYLPDGSDKDMLLVKVSSSGTIEWSKAIHHGLDDGSPSITEVSDGYLFTAEVENTTVPGTPGQAIVGGKRCRPWTTTGWRLAAPIERGRTHGAIQTHATQKSPHDHHDRRPRDGSVCLQDACRMGNWGVGS